MYFVLMLAFMAYLKGFWKKLNEKNQNQEMADPFFQHWFHGRISRQEAEELLARSGKKDGLYLLRESTASAGSYALSMCHNNKIIHYHIQRHTDGMVAIEDGKKFPGPVELVQHHYRALDGLLTKLTEPCNRLPGVPPKTFSGANQEHIKDAAIAAIASMRLEVSCKYMYNQTLFFVDASIVVDGTFVITLAYDSHQTLPNMSEGETNSC